MENLLYIKRQEEFAQRNMLHSLTLWCVTWWHNKDIMMSAWGDNDFIIRLHVAIPQWNLKPFTKRMHSRPAFPRACADWHYSLTTLLRYEHRHTLYFSPQSRTHSLYTRMCCCNAARWLVGSINRRPKTAFMHISKVLCGYRTSEWWGKRPKIKTFPVSYYGV